MQAYSAAIRGLFQAHADPSQAGAMSAYMRNQFPYLGIKSDKNGELQKQFFASHGLPALEELDIILRELWNLPEREFQYIAIGLLMKFEKKLPPEFISTMEYLITTKSWWDTVDTIAGHPLGVHFQRYPDVRDSALAVWRRSDNFWLRRSCILFQLGYKKDTDFELMKEIIRENLGSKEFFINKAIGWALRQHTRIDPDGVREFVAATPLHPLSAREALKWLEKRAKK
jgi:3-methyladenine DNA glycosylase AlkD